MDGQIGLRPSLFQSESSNSLTYEDADVCCHPSSLGVLYRGHTLYRGHEGTDQIPVFRNLIDPTYLSTARGQLMELRARGTKWK
jgi:hypothetical protein